MDGKGGGVNVGESPDVVPGILSLAHTARVLKEEVERTFSDLTGGLSEVLKHQLLDFLRKHQGAITTAASLIQAVCSQDEGMKHVVQSIVQVHNSNTSTV